MHDVYFLAYGFNLIHWTLIWAKPSKSANLLGFMAPCRLCFVKLKGFGFVKGTWFWFVQCEWFWFVKFTLLS